MNDTRVAIIGAGYAGMAAAVELVRMGLDVTVFESSRVLGGRARVVEKDGYRLDNGQHILLGAYTERSAAEIERLMTLVFDYFPRLSERRSQPAGLMSGGEQQMLAIGRALMAKPRLILMDEPSLGLSPKLVRDIFAIVKRLKDEQGATILLVEQNAKAALEVADYGYVFELGKVALKGTVTEILATEAIRNSYLGKARPAEPAQYVAPSAQNVRAV